MLSDLPLLFSFYSPHPLFLSSSLLLFCAGAFIGWLIIRKILGPVLFGISFAFTAGMMVYVVITTLLPTAIKLDSKTNGYLVAGFTVLGMALFALSIALFGYA